MSFNVDDDVNVDANVDDDADVDDGGDGGDGDGDDGDGDDGDGDDGDDDDGDDDEDDDERKMIIWMLRTRKRIKSRRMMLRRKTDPKTGNHTFCKPAQSKCTWTCQKSDFEWKFRGKVPDGNPAARVVCEPAQSKCTWAFHKSHFVLKFTGKMPAASETTSIKHRALTVSVRTPHFGRTVWGISS